ncbi:MAG: DNA polymerase III subunit delta' [Paludibacteraceae bacterium]|nr:DNA polymerase III subunit delta' [Paludibacteraceae bacterium]
MFFRDVIGYDSLKDIFRQMVVQDRIPHAMLLSGIQGVGKLPMAIAMARYIMCSDRGDVDSCGSCRSCAQVQNLTHPDLHFVFPIVQNKASKIVICDDLITEFRDCVLQNPFVTGEQWFARIGESKIGQIYTEEGNEIIRKISLKPYQGNRKVMIIWQPELMHTACANRLLKILEEPPLDTVFILVSDHPEQILLTIRSRCRNFEFSPLEADRMRAEISARYTNISDDQMNYLVRSSRGCWGELLRLVKATDEDNQNFELFKRMMRTSFKFSIFEIRKFSEEFARLGRNAQLAFLRYSQRLIRENFVCHVGMSDLSYMNADEVQFASRFSAFISERNVLKISSELALAESQIAQNTNSEIVIFHTLIKLYIHLKKH